MGFFDRKKHELPPLMDEADIIPPYNVVLEYLVGLSADDYEKVIKVAGIYRQADQDACDALGKPNEPTTFIEPPKLSDSRFTDDDGRINIDKTNSLVDDDDELNKAFPDDDDDPEFLEDDKPQGKKVKVNKG